MNVFTPVCRVSGAVAVAWLAPLLVACGGGGGGEEVDAVFRLLSEPSASPAQVTRGFVGVLDTDSRARVEAHAIALSSELGVPVEAADVLMLGGLEPGLRVNEVAIESGSVKVSLGRIDQGGAAAPLMAEPIVWRAREEGGRARLVLPDGILPAAGSGGAP